MRTPSAALAGLVMAGLAGSLAYPAQAGLITLTVAQGGGGDFTSLTAAVAVANADLDLANDYMIQLAPGTYVNDYANVRRPMMIEGMGSGATLQSTIPLPNQKGIIHTTASLFVKGITFTGAFIADALGGNGAGIRDQMTGGGTLRIEDSVFKGNQEGILTGGSGNQEHVIVKNTKFLDNGRSGQEHGLYVNNAASVDIDGALFCGQKGGGHNIKLRSVQSTISNVQSYEGTLGPGCSGAGAASRGIDLSNGGVVSLNHVDLFQGSGSPNFSLLAFGPEGLPYAVNSLSLNNVSFNSASGGVGIQWFAGSNPCTLQDVTFSGVANQTTPAGACSGGVITEQPPGDPVAVPEPGSLALLLAGLAGLAGTIRRIRAAA